jgi:hypothetical protein
MISHFTYLPSSPKKAVGVEKLPSLIAEEGPLVVIDPVYSITTKDDSPILDLFSAVGWFLQVINRKPLLGT